MRLSRVKIKNFKSIKDLELRIPERDEKRQGSADFVSILGENNVGKSSILEAIRLALPGSPKPSIELFPGLDPSNGPIEVEFEFNRLTETDKQEQAIRVHVYTEDDVEKYRIKKVWASPNAAPEYFAYRPDAKEYDFKEWPTPNGKNDLKGLSPDWKNLVEATEKENPAKKLGKALYLKTAISINSPLINESASSPWVSNPGGNHSNVDTILPNVVYIPALRETSHEADVRDKQSTIRKIVNTLFEQQLSNHERVVRFRRAAVELEHLFAVTGKHKIVTYVEAKITSKLKELIDINADLRFKAPDVTSDLASRTEFWVQDGAVSTRPENQGHGAQRSIVLALLQMYAEQLRESQGTENRPTIFLFEEPEIYMHPEMCRRMRDTLLRIAQSGIAQVVCTTHSPVFLDLADRHDGIVIVRKENGNPVIKQRVKDVFEQSPTGKQGRDRLRMLLNFDPVANEVFFSDSVCLVEGDCEVASIDAVARRLDELGEIYWPTYLSARRAVAIINCRGKWTINAFQEVLRAFEINYRVVHDGDEDDSPNGANERIHGHLSPGDSLLVHHPNFEQQIFGETWTRDKPWRATEKIKTINTDQNKGLLNFFEFTLGKKISQLRQPADNTTATGPIAIPPPLRRNLRHELKKFDVPADVIQQARQLNQVIRLAAGPNFTPDVAEVSRFHPINGLPISTFAVVSGDSMADTLVNGDIVALKFLDSVYLNPVGEGKKVSGQQFCEFIENNGIYVLAINEEIEQREYTIKRIRIRALANGGWFGQLCADNPESAWGNRGRIDIFKTDRVHFAAKVVGIVNQSITEETGSAESLLAQEA
ncbi:MAG TPA: AAA family ATPase [Archangium sp.]|nr:AAA family ATPase [Archangium sp.]